MYIYRLEYTKQITRAIVAKNLFIAEVADRLAGRTSSKAHEFAYIRPVTFYSNQDEEECFVTNLVWV